MAFVTGTATDAEDLLSRFRTFITSDASLAAESPSQVWTEQEYTTYTDGNGNTRYELYLTGPGLAGTDNIHVNIDLFKDITAGSDVWTWTNYGATSYNSSLSISNQPGTLTNPKFMPLWDSTIPYWFYANGRRFIIIAQITASVYVNCYCGFILPYSPSVAALEYTYPLFIGASMHSSGYRFSETSNRHHRSFWRPCNLANNTGSSAIRTSANSWHELINVSNTDSDSILTSINSLTAGGIEPYIDYTYTNISSLRVSNQELLLGGDYLLSECRVANPSTNTSLSDAYGVLDGVAHLSGVSQSSQNTITVGSDTYTVFQEAHRTGQSDFVAIKQ